MESLYVCKECGRPELQVKAFIDVNTHKFIELMEDNDAWCVVCKKYVLIEPAEGTIRKSNTKQTGLF